MQSRREGLQTEVTKTKTLAPRVEKLVLSRGFFLGWWLRVERRGRGLPAELHIYCSTFIALQPVWGLRELGRTVWMLNDE